MQSPRQAQESSSRRSALPRIITLSGVDCSGKSTQIEPLMELLRRRGEMPRCLWLRIGYTPLFCALKRALRRLLGRGMVPQGDSTDRDRFMATGWKRTLWLHLAMMDMAFETAIRIRALRILGYTVICDRYIDESEMDLELNFGESAAKMPAWKLVKAIAAKPDLSVLFDLSYEDGLARSVLKQEPYPDPEPKRRLRAKLYERLKNDGSYWIVDARMSIDEVAARIAQHLAGTDRCAHAPGTLE